MVLITVIYTVLSKPQREETEAGKGQSTTSKFSAGSLSFLEKCVQQQSVSNLLK